jgi:glycosyltransferase involved in cell wall biosynthesis
LFIDYRENRTKPKFTIITAVLNGQNTLQRCIDSIKQQEFKDFEYIVIDGVSTDQTVEIIKSNLDFISVFLSEPDSGIADAWNKAIALAHGKIIGILNCDDVYYPKTLAIVNSLDENIDHAVYYGAMNYLGANSDTLYVSVSELSTRMICHPSVFVTAKTYEDFGNFETSFKVASDYALMARLYTNGVKFLSTPEPLSEYSLGGYSARYRSISIRESLRVQKNYFKISLWKIAYRFLKISLVSKIRLHS